jgi:hypothetical protein
VNALPPLNRTKSWILFALVSILYPFHLAEAKPGSVKVGYDPMTASLNVSVKTTDAEVVLYDQAMNQEIARQTGVSKQANFKLTKLPIVPCSVRIESGGASVVPLALTVKIAATPRHNELSNRRRDVSTVMNNHNAASATESPARYVTFLPQGSARPHASLAPS